MLYKHRYGGIYSIDFKSVLSTVDKTELVVYTHVWPFEQTTWARPASEFNDGRFTEINEAEVSKLIALNDREEYKLAIAAAKLNK